MQAFANYHEEFSEGCSSEELQEATESLQILVIIVTLSGLLVRIWS